MNQSQSQQNRTAPQKNPGILTETDKRKKLIEEVARTIHKAAFIPDEKEKNWIKLLPYLSDNFLKELKQSIIRESLRKLATKNKQKI